jgi:hypothetical protein
MVVAFAFAAYHWPVSIIALFRDRRLPFWLIASGMIATMGMYAWLLLWLVGSST